MLSAIRRRFQMQACRLMQTTVRMTYYISFPDKPAYLSLTTAHTAQSASPATKSGDEQTKQQSDCQSVAVSTDFPNALRNSFVTAEVASSDGTDVVSDYVSSCMSLQEIFRTVSKTKSCEVVLGARRELLSGNRIGLQRCVFFFPPTEDQSSLESLLADVTWPDSVSLYRFMKCGNVGKFRRRKFSQTKIIDSDSAEEEAEVVNVQMTCTSLGPNAQPGVVAPMLASTEFSPVIHTLQRTLDILHNVPRTAEVSELLKIGQQELPQKLDVENLQAQMKQAFVVVEGMDATGKTTLTEKLEARLNAVRYYTPPPCIQHLRKYFDSLPEIVRRSYYCLGNYIVSAQIAKECRTRCAIMDRFWHSTAAYGVAKETSLSDLPPPGHVTYSWPDDLLRPTSVLFLTVSEDVRKQRMSGRATTMTVEEHSLDRDSLFRQRLCLAYRRMEDPGCLEIDAAGCPEQVVEKALAVLLEAGVAVT